MKTATSNKIIPFTILMLACQLAAANDVDIELSLLTKKIGLCEASIKAKNCVNTEYCQDFHGYEKYIFKGSLSAYLEYNTEAGNINKRNIKAFDAYIDQSTKLLKLEASRLGSIEECS